MRSTWPKWWRGDLGFAGSEGRYVNHGGAMWTLFFPERDEQREWASAPAEFYFYERDDFTSIFRDALEGLGYPEVRRIVYDRIRIYPKCHAAYYFEHIHEPRRETLAPMNPHLPVYVKGR